MTISKQDMEAHYQEKYKQKIEFADVRFIKTGSIFHRKHFAIAFCSIAGTKPESQHEAAHLCSQAKYYVVPIEHKQLADEGMLYTMSSFAPHNRYFYNTEGKNENWCTAEVFVEITAGETCLARIHSSGTGDTPYILATDNIQVKSWFERSLPVYDFVVDPGLSEHDKIMLNDNDIKKRRTIIYKFALEFFNTFILTNAEVKAEQERVKRLKREETLRKKEKRRQERAVIRAAQKAAAAQRAAARTKVQMDDQDSLDKKKLMTEFLGKDIFG